MPAKRSILVILALAAAIRLLWVVLVPNGQYSDSVWYDGAAANLAARGMYGPDQTPSAWFPPGYPFFLAAIYTFVGHEELAGKLGNVVIGVALVGFTYLLGRRVAGEAVGLIGAALVAVWPNLIFHTGILSSDLLAACGFAAVMWLGMRERQHPLLTVLLGLLIGWAILVRPVSVILLAALGLWWWISRRSLRHAIVSLVPITLLAVVVVGAWTARNYLTFGEPIAIATNGGYNFWQTNHRYADGNDTFWPFVPMDDPEYQTMSTGDEFTKNREGYRYALAYLRDHPTHILTMLPTKLFWLYHTDTSGFYEGVYFAPMEAPSAVAKWFVDHEHLAESLTFRYYELILILAALGLLLALPTHPKLVVPLVALPVLLTSFHLFFHAKDRFHIPLDPIFALLASVAIVEAYSFVRRFSAARQLRIPAVTD